MPGTRPHPLIEDAGPLLERPDIGSATLLAVPALPRTWPLTGGIEAAAFVAREADRLDAAESDIAAALSAVGGVTLSRYTVGALGLYRIFNAAEYRFRWGAAPPAEDDPVDDVNATLPFSPLDTFGNGTHHLAVEYFNGVTASGFRSFNALFGARSRRIDIAAGVQVDPPPKGVYFGLEPRSGGVVRVAAYYAEPGALRATHWALAYTFDGSTPAAGAPNVVQAFTSARGFELLVYDLPAQADGTTVKVRVQVRRGASTYSENSSVLTTTAIAVGKSAPSAGSEA